MTKRIAVIAGLVIVFGATAAVAVAIWPDRAGEEGATSTSEGQALSVAVPSVTAPNIGTVAIPAATRFALRPLTGPLPVPYRFKHPPLAGILFDLKSGE